MAETKANSQTVPTGRRCTVCSHSDVNAINSLLASASLTNRGIARQFGFSPGAVDRHKNEHLPARIARAAERKENKAEDRFMDHVEFLMDESRQYVRDAHGAVKYQLVAKDTYAKLRDVGAMGPAINAAKNVGDLYGQATGRLTKDANMGDRKPFLIIVAPLSITAPAAADPGKPLLEDGNTIDITALGE